MWNKLVNFLVWKKEEKPSAMINDNDPMVKEPLSLIENYVYFQKPTGG